MGLMTPPKMWYNPRYSPQTPGPTGPECPDHAQGGAVAVGVGANVAHPVFCGVVACGARLDALAHRHHALGKVPHALFVSGEHVKHETQSGASSNARKARHLSTADSINLEGNCMGRSYIWRHDPTLALCISLTYVGVLLAVSRWSSRRAGSEEDVFFVAKKSAPWPLVAFGMVGASLSGVTFLSIPGWVRDQEWTYMQMVFGYCIGYLIVATVLLPLYYKLGLTSIYSFLGTRFGTEARKTGSAFSC